MECAVKIESERLWLRSFVQEDLGAYHRLLSDEAALVCAPELLSRGEAETRRRLMEAILDAGHPATGRKRLFLAVERKADGAFLGTAGYTTREEAPVGKVVRAGWFLLPEHHGQGYATEAARALMGFAFEADGVYRIEARCLAENAASERVMQKCGMVQEGFFPRCTWRDGAMRDRVAYRLLREEYGA